MGLPLYATSSGGARPAPAIAARTGRSTSGVTSPTASSAGKSPTRSEVTRTLGYVASGQSAAAIRRSASDEADDRNSAGDALAQARISVAPSTASSTAGLRNTSVGARVQGGSRNAEPSRRGRPGRCGGAEPAGGPEPSVDWVSGPDRVRSSVGPLMDVTLSEDQVGPGHRCGIVRIVARS
jgi:hypothetical protein